MIIAIMNIMIIIIMIKTILMMITIIMIIITIIIIITINRTPSKLESTLRRASAPNLHDAELAGSEAGKFAGAACSGKKAAEQSAAARALDALEEWLGTTRFRPVGGSGWFNGVVETWG